MLRTTEQKKKYIQATRAQNYQASLKLEGEPYRVCRRVNILRDYPDDKIKIYP